jgi:hypothetical protein
MAMSMIALMVHVMLALSGPLRFVSLRMSGTMSSAITAITYIKKRGGTSRRLADSRSRKKYIRSTRG